MGLLNQIFSDGGGAEIQVEELTEDGLTSAATSMAAHKEMAGDNDENEGNTTERDPGFTGSVNVNRSLSAARSYEQILMSNALNDSLEKLDTHETADDVFSGGIKEGSKVLIHLTNEKTSPQANWDNLVQRVFQQRGDLGRVIFDKFSVNSLTEPDQERYQIVQTYGADLLYGFGRRPRMMRMIGRVVNGQVQIRTPSGVKSMDWKNAMQRQYAQNMRLTEQIRNPDTRIMIHAQDTVYVGYLLNMQTFTTAAEQGLGQVTLTFIIAERNFTNENDNKIPGWQTESGAIVADKTIPDKVFSKVEPDEYLVNNDPGKIAGLEIQKTKVQELLKKIVDTGWPIKNPGSKTDLETIEEKHQKGRHEAQVNLSLYVQKKIKNTGLEGVHRLNNMGLVSHAGWDIHEIFKKADAIPSILKRHELKGGAGLDKALPEFDGASDAETELFKGEPPDDSIRDDFKEGTVKRSAAQEDAFEKTLGRLNQLTEQWVTLNAVNTYKRRRE